MPHKIIGNQIYHVRLDFHVLKVESTTVEVVGNARNDVFYAKYSELMTKMEGFYIMVLKTRDEQVVLQG